MKTILKTTMAIAVAATLFTGCTDAINDALGMSPEDMDKIIIYNETDVAQCENRIPVHTNSVIEFESSERTCEDYGRTEGSNCTVYYESTNNSGHTTCVIGYDVD